MDIKRSLEEEKVFQLLHFAERYSVVVILKALGLLN